MTSIRASIRSAAVLLVAAILMTACQRESADAPLKLTGRMFVFNYRFSYATYMITLEKTSPLPDGSQVTATFQNPLGGAPLTLERRLFAKLDKVVLESPHLECVKKDIPYAVTVTLRDPGGAELQKLDITVTSNLDQSILAARPLVVGPVYDKNPEIFKDGSALPDLSEKAACPA